MFKADKDHKREFNSLNLCDYDGVRERLERRSEEGWMLERIGNFFWHYRRVEPKRRRVAVAYFPAASASDPGPSEGQRDYQQLCEDAGWELKAQWGQMQIFYSEEEDPIPIDTDPVQQLDTVHRSMKRSMLPVWWLLLALSVFQLLMQGRTLWREPVEALSGSGWLLFLMWLLLMGTNAVELARYYRWHRRARAAAEAGEWTKSLHHGKSGWLLLLIPLALYAYVAAESGGKLLLMLAYTLALFGIVFLTTCLRDALKGLGVPAWVSRAATIALSVVLSFALVGLLIAATFYGLDRHWLDRAPAETYEYKGHTWDVYHDELPLTIQDLSDIDYDGWSTELERQSSPLVTRIEATQRGRIGDSDFPIPELNYEIAVVHFAPLYSFCRNGLLREVERHNRRDVPEYWDLYQPCDAAPWGTSEAYRLYTAGEPRNQFLLCWKNRLAVLDLPYQWEVTEELMSTAGAKLLAAD